MEHLHYLFCLVALMTATAILAMGFRQARLTKNRPLAVFLIFYAIFSLQLMGNLISMYLLVTMRDTTQAILPIVIFISQILFSSLLWAIACLPLFLHDSAWRRQGALFFGLIFAGYTWIFLAGIHWQPEYPGYQVEPYLSWLWVPVVLTTNLWALGYGWLRHRRSDPQVKVIQRRLIPLMTLFLPVWLIDLIWPGLVANLVVPILYILLSIGLIIAIRHSQAMRQTKPAETAIADQAAAWGLSLRESEVLRMILQGLGNQQLASALFISPNTVKTHIKSILRKAQATSRFELLCRFNRPTGDRS